jgi:hypothetical protein
VPNPGALVLLGDDFIELAAEDSMVRYAGRPGGEGVFEVAPAVGEFGGGHGAGRVDRLVGHREFLAVSAVVWRDTAHLGIVVRRVRGSW